MSQNMTHEPIRKLNRHCSSLLKYPYLERLPSIRRALIDPSKRPNFFAGNRTTTRDEMKGSADLPRFNAYASCVAQTMFLSGAVLPTPCVTYPEFLLRASRAGISRSSRIPEPLQLSRSSVTKYLVANMHLVLL